MAGERFWIMLYKIGRTLVRFLLHFPNRTTFQSKIFEKWLICMNQFWFLGFAPVSQLSHPLKPRWFYMASGNETTSTLIFYLIFFTTLLHATALDFLCNKYNIIIKMSKEDLLIFVIFKCGLGQSTLWLRSPLGLSSSSLAELLYFKSYLPV